VGLIAPGDARQSRLPKQVIAGGARGCKGLAGGEIN